MIFYYMLLLSLALANQRYLDYRLFGFTVEKYLGLLVLLVALFYLTIRKSPVNLWRSWQTRAFLFFLVLAGVSWFTMGRTPFHSSMFLVYLSQVAFLVSTLILVDRPERLRWSILVVLASMTLASLYALREWQKLYPLYGFGFRPSWGPAGDPNYFAASAVICLPIAFYFFIWSPNRFDRWFSAACTLPIVAAILVGASRGGLLALLAAGVVILWQSRNLRRKFLFLGGLFLIVLLVSPASPVRRFLHPSSGDVTSENDRLALWSAGLHMIEAHPLAGIGLDNFKAEVPAYLAPGQHIDYIAHNTYIEMAAEMGVPGIALFLWILVATFKSLARTRRSAWESNSPILYSVASGLRAGTAGFCVAMFFLSAEFLKLLWFAVFFSVAIEAMTVATSRARTSVDEAPEDQPFRNPYPADTVPAWSPSTDSSPLGEEWPTRIRTSFDG